MRELYTYWPDSYYDENGEAICLCPVTGQNFFKWDENFEAYPKELIFIEHAEIGEPIYIRPDYKDLYDKFYNSEEEIDESPKDFFINHLPMDKEYTKLVVEYPDFIAGDYTIYIYEGIY